MSVILRAGKTKNILESSIESALLVVEIYNKPQLPFKLENYVILMVIAWTRLFHAHFNNTMGARYYYKEKDGRHYKRIDGEKKTWELKTCIKKCSGLKKEIRSNLIFFIELRNKIEHRHINSCEIDEILFGECQALLYNYENTLVEFFGDEYAIGANLAYSLQFSRSRTRSQKESIKMQLSQDVKDFKHFIYNFRDNLDSEIYDTQEFSVKLIQIPKITNSNKADYAINFINLDKASDEDRETCDKIHAIIKQKKEFIEVVNFNNHKISEVVDIINDGLLENISIHDLVCLNKIFSIRPYKDGNQDPFDTISDYCLYDKVHKDYIYTNQYVELIKKIISDKKIKSPDWRAMSKSGDKLNISEYQAVTESKTPFL